MKYREKVRDALRCDDFEELTTLAIEMSLLLDKKATIARTTGLELYSAPFQEAWEHYPARTGGNSKREAWAAWQARLRSKLLIVPLDMIAGTKRYKAYCDREGITGTRSVMQARRFYGIAMHFQESWDDKTPPPAATNENTEDLKWKAQRAQQEIDRRRGERDGDEWWRAMQETARAKGFKTHAELLFFAASQVAT